MQSGKNYNYKNKILVICPHPEGVAPGQRLKYEQYFDYFREQGIQVDVSPFMTPRFQDIVYKKGRILEKIWWTIVGYLIRIKDLFRLKNYDAIYVFLWVTPFGPPLFESLYCMMNKNIVYDIDDMIFLKDTSKANSFISILKGRGRMIHLLKKAKQIIVCTPSLEEVAKKYNNPAVITDISSTINTDTYIPVNAYSNNRKLTLGWSGSITTSQYMKILEPVLNRLKQKYDFDILVIGDAAFQFSDIECTAIKWEEKFEIKNLQRIDIGLYPLPLNDPWVMGKSGLKALQYMALGIPTVATAIGANYRVIENGVSGFLVKTDDEWVEVLGNLIEKSELRKRIGEAGRTRVENYFSIKANRDTYLNILKRVIK